MAFPTIGLTVVVENLDDFKRAAQTIEKAYGTLEKESKEVVDASSKASAALDKTRKPFLDLSNIAGVAKTALAGYVASLGVREIVQFGKESVQAYQRLAAGKGALLATVGSVEEYNNVINKAREATRGMVPEAELASAANVLLASHLAQSTDEAAQLINAGSILTGVFASSGATIEKFGRLLASGNQVLFDNFGLTMSMVQAKQAEVEATQGLTGQEARLKAIRELLLDSAEKYQSSVSDSEVASRQWQAAIEDLKASIGEELAPAAADLAETLAKGIRAFSEGKKALAEQREEIFNTSESFTEYTRRLRQAGLALDMNRKQFDDNKTTIEAGRKSVEGLEHEQRKLTDATRAAAHATIEQEKAMFREEQAAEKSRQQRLRNIEAIKEWTEEQRKAAEEAQKLMQTQAQTAADFFLQLREAQSQAILDEQEFNTSLAEIRGGGAEQQATAQESLNKKLEDLAKQREEKIHWVLTGAHARTQEENERDLGYWNAYYDDLETKARAGYAEQNAEISGKLAEREAALNAARQKEIEAQQAALERMKLLAALTILETTGQLEQFTGGMATTAADAADLIDSGVLPLTRDMALEIQTLVGELATSNEQAMQRSQANATLLTQALAGDLEQTARPAVQNLDLDFQTITGTTMPGMQAKSTETAGSMQADLGKVATSLVGEGGIKDAAEEATKAMADGFQKAKDKIEDKLIPKLKDLTDWLEKVESAAKRAADATRGLGGAAGGAGAPEFQAGGSFVVPPGFGPETRGFPMTVHSGELINVITRQQIVSGPVAPALAAAGAAGGGGRSVNNYFNMTVNTAATSGTVAQDFGIMRSLLGD